MLKIVCYVSCHVAEKLNSCWAFFVIPNFNYNTVWVSMVLILIIVLVCSNNLHPNTSRQVILIVSISTYDIVRLMYLIYLNQSSKTMDRRYFLLGVVTLPRVGNNAGYVKNHSGTNFAPNNRETKGPQPYFWYNRYGLRLQTAGTTICTGTSTCQGHSDVFFLQKLPVAEGTSQSWRHIKWTLCRKNKVFYDYFRNQYYFIHLKFMYF